MSYWWNLGQSEGGQNLQACICCLSEIPLSGQKIYVIFRCKVDAITDNAVNPECWPLKLAAVININSKVHILKFAIAQSEPITSCILLSGRLMCYMWLSTLWPLRKCKKNYSSFLFLLCNSYSSALCCTSPIYLLKSVVALFQHVHCLLKPEKPFP